MDKELSKAYSLYIIPDPVLFNFFTLLFLMQVWLF